MRTEIIGGLTTFMTMAYIVVVNPAILSFAGFPVGPSTVATVLTAVFGCLLMAFYANKPIAVAPYMGENAFIAFGLAAMHISFQQRLGAVFISGCLFLLLSVFRIRGWLANSISTSMKHAFAAGIGLFLTFIGMFETKICVSGAPAVPVKLGDFHSPEVLLAVGTFFLIASLQYRKVKGAILIGIAFSAIVGTLCGFGQAPKALFALPFTGEYTLKGLALQLDIPGVLQLSFFPLLLTLFLMSFLDTLGTLVGVGSAGDMLDKDGNFPDIEKPMLVDSLSCIFSSLVGSSTSGAFIESATGIKEGARTGLAALVCAVMFFSCLFFLPLLEPLQHLTYAYAPALMSVGLLMMASVTKIDLDDLTEAVPAFATIVMMIFTYNIANGITAGLILYPLFKLCAGRAKELHPGAIVLGLLCLIYYVFGLPH